jgi:integrase
MMVSEQHSPVLQPRKPTSWIEDTWRKKDGTPKARNGIGKRWRVWVVSLDGERDSGTYFDRKLDAEAHRDDALSKLRVGSYVTEKAGRVTMAAVYEQYLSHQKAGSTKAKRVSAWNAWVQPKWAKYQLRYITRSGVKAWIVEMGEQDAKPATIELAMEVLRGILQVAVDDKRLAENVARGHNLPARTKKARAYLSHEQVWELSEEVDPRYRTLILTLGYTGLRFGEAAALTVADLDLLRRLVRVRQQVTEAEGGKLIWTPTKGKRRREVPIPRFLVEPLSVACQSKRRTDQVFTAPKGGVLRLNTWRDRLFTPVIDSLVESDTAFPTATPHDLRHTAASLAVSAGANVKALQTMLGHQSAVETLDTYADLFPEDLERVAATLDTAVEAMNARAQSAK